MNDNGQEENSEESFNYETPKGYVYSTLRNAIGKKLYCRCGQEGESAIININTFQVFCNKCGPSMEKNQ
jgi:hypothetical protein